MKMSVEFLIARRYLRPHGRGWISVVSLISVCGVALGVLTLIVVLAVMNGFREEVRSRIVGANAHVMIMRHDRDAITGYQPLVEKVRTHPEVLGAAPFIYGKALVSCGGEAEGGVVRGLLDPEERAVTDIMKFVKPAGATLREPEPGPEGKPLAPVILGRELAYQLRATPGDSVLLTTVSQEGAGVMSFIPRTEACVVVGIFDSGMYDFDASLTLVPLATAQRLLGMGDGVSGIAVRVPDIYRAGAVGRELVDMLGYGSLGSVDWMELNPNLFSWMELEKLVMFMLLVMIILVAAFNIASSLIMLVIEKTRDIGVLKAMGADRQRIARIFVLEGLIIGGAGTLLGVLGGVLLAVILGRYRIISLPPEVYFIDRLPVRLEMGDVLWTAAVALLISFLVTLYPSRKAASMHPVEAIRYE